MTSESVAPDDKLGSATSVYISSARVAADFRSLVAVFTEGWLEEAAYSSGAAPA